MCECKVENVMARLSELCIEKKKTLGLANKEIAKKAGKSETYVSRFINGKIDDPYLADINAMCNALGINFNLSVDWLNG